MAPEANLKNVRKKQKLMDTQEQQRQRLEQERERKRQMEEDRLRKERERQLYEENLRLKQQRELLLQQQVHPSLPFPSSLWLHSWFIYLNERITDVYFIHSERRNDWQLWNVSDCSKKKERDLKQNLPKRSHKLTTTPATTAQAPIQHLPPKNLTPRMT